MDATVELLREGGLRAAAPAAIAERAGAGKMSLYRHFGGKDDLVAAALRDHLPTQKQRLMGTRDDRGPRQWILAVFDRLAGLADDGTLTACVYLTTRLEVADLDHPAVSVAGEYKREIVEAFAELLREIGHEDAEPTARVISMLLDGAVVHSIIAGDSAPLKDARVAVERMLGPDAS